MITQLLQKGRMSEDDCCRATVDDATAAASLPSSLRSLRGSLRCQPRLGRGPDIGAFAIPEGHLSWSQLGGRALFVSLWAISWEGDKWGARHNEGRGRQSAAFFPLPLYEYYSPLLLSLLPLHLS